MSFRRSYNALARQVPFLSAFKRAVLSPLDRAINRHHFMLLEALRAYVPNSSAELEAMSSLTLQAASQTVPFMVAAIENARGGALAAPVSISGFVATPEATAAAERLKVHLDAQGSDKADRHDYHRLYGPLIDGLPSQFKMLEVGLGSNNTDVASNMGAEGKPGASLRAFTAFRPDASIYGADVDKRILFQEGRIKTFFVDQTDPASFAALERETGAAFDLVIDDGLHSPNANLATMAFALRNLKPGGWFVIEDISASALPVWQIVAAAMPARFDCRIIEARAALMFVARAPEEPMRH